MNPFGRKTLQVRTERLKMRGKKTQKSEGQKLKAGNRKKGKGECALGKQKNSEDIGQ